MEAVEIEDYLFYISENHRLEVQPHYARKDFHLDRRTSSAHGWHGGYEMTREQVRELRDMLSRALEEWTYEH